MSIDADTGGVLGPGVVAFTLRLVGHLASNVARHEVITLHRLYQNLAL
jgi:hypothetical protein